MTEILFARKDDVDNIGLVDIIAGVGLSGGGNISGPGDITINLDINELGIIAPALADSVAIYDASGATHGKADFTSINAILDHDALLGFVADEHIAHSGVVLTAGVGLSGGGDISVSRTFNLDLNDLTSDTPVLGDTIAFYDVSGADTNKATFTAVNAILDHDALVNFVANEHIDHSAVVLTAGAGLTGGGDITVSRTFNLDLNDLTADTPVAGDLFAFYDVSGADTNKVTATGSGNVVLATSPQFTTDIRPSVNDGASIGILGTAFSDVFLASGSFIDWDNNDVRITHAANSLTFSGGTSYTYDNSVYIRHPTIGSYLVLDPITAAQQALINFQQGGAGRWQLGKQTEDSFILFDTVAASLVLAIPSNGSTINLLRTLVPNTDDLVGLGTGTLSFADLFLATGGTLNFGNGNYVITHTAGDLGFSGIVTLPNTGLHLRDTNASHDLIIVPGSDLTVDRTLTITTGDASRTLTISGNTTISQDYSTTGNPQFATIELGAATDTTLARSSAGNVTIEGNIIYRAGGTDVPVTDGGTGASDAATARTNLGVAYGKQTVWVPAAAMIPRATNGPAVGTVEMTTNKNMVKTLDFDATTQEFAQFDIRMPKSWDESTVTFIPVWSHAATVTNFGVVWGLDAVAISNDDTLDVAFGTAQTSTDTGGTTNDSYQGPESSAITIAGTPVEGDYVQFRIHRDPANGSDTMAIDARLHGVLLLYSNSSNNDT